MSRRKIKKAVENCNDYDSYIIKKLVNYVMQDGKKCISKYIVENAMSNLKKKIQIDSKIIIRRIIKNIKPCVEVKSRKIGGVTYKIPVEIGESRATSIALKWIVKTARTRKDSKSMVKKLYLELLDVYLRKGKSLKKKEDMHRVAESNRAFSNYKW